MKPAFGAVSMLLAIAIIGVLAILTLPVLKTTTSTNLNDSSLKQESVDETVDDLVKEIEMRKQETMEYYNNLPE